MHIYLAKKTAPLVCSWNSDRSICMIVLIQIPSTCIHTLQRKWHLWYVHGTSDRSICMTVLIQIPLGFPVSKQLRVPEFILCSLGSGTLYVACEIKDENVVAVPTSVPTSLKRSFYFDVLCPVIPANSQTSAVETIMSTSRGWYFYAHSLPTLFLQSTT